MVSKKVGEERIGNLICKTDIPGQACCVLYNKGVGYAKRGFQSH